MSGSQDWKAVLVLPEDLIDFAWSAPMRELASAVGLSDVGLKKQLTGHGISVPPQGYWNKLRAGKPVPSRAKPDERRPGETGRIMVDARFAVAVPISRPIPSGGPFESKFVPEDLGRLYKQELAAIGVVTVPRSIARGRFGFDAIFAKEERRRAKQAATTWNIGGPLYEAAAAKRLMRVMNALFSALAKRGHHGSVYEHDNQLQMRIRIGETSVGTEITVAGQNWRNRQTSFDAMPANADIAIHLTRDFDGVVSETWRDDKSGKIEEKLANLAASLIVEGERRFRSQLKKDEWIEEQRRIEEETRRTERLEKLNATRLANLKTSGDLMRQAQDIRALVAEVGQAIRDGVHQLDPSKVEAWEKWALGEADRLDPIKSGQFTSHFYPTTDV